MPMLISQLITLLTRSSIEALVRQERDSVASLNWKPPIQPWWLGSHIPYVDRKIV